MILLLKVCIIMENAGQFAIVLEKRWAKHKFFCQQLMMEGSQLKDTILFVVVPCYNEEEVLGETNKRLTKKLKSMIEGEKISPKSRILYVDDGSKDKTWSIIEEFHDRFPLVSGLKISRNRGHQNALYGGLMTAKEYCDCAVSIDADLQDNIEVLEAFMEKFDQGRDIVYGVRSDRSTDSFFKRKTATSYYTMMNKMGADVIYNHADCRLMSKRALEALADFKEVNLFLRGMVPLIGFTTDTVEYKRDKRFAGESKYPLKKMLALAFDGITSFSIKPIRWITFIGFFIFACSIIALLYSVITYFMGRANSGWPSLMVSIWMLGGLQLLAMGIIGEYLGKIYMEVKGRPRYIVDKLLHRD